MLREMIIDFMLFSFVEGLLYAMFFNRVCKCKKFNIFEIIVMSIGNCVVSCLFPPIIYQIFMMGWMAFCLHLKNGTDHTTFQYVKYSFLVMVGQLIIEMVFAMFYDFVLNIDFSKSSSLTVFAIMIPIRVIQFIIIYKLGGFNMKGWMGGVVRK